MCNKSNKSINPSQVESSAKFQHLNRLCAVVPARKGAQQLRVLLTSPWCSVAGSALPGIPQELWCKIIQQLFQAEVNFTAFEGNFVLIESKPG